MSRLLTISISVLFMLCSCAGIQSTDANAPITADPEGRTMGEVIDDKNLRSRLLFNLDALDSRFKNANVDIHVSTGIVLILGQVPTQELVDLATTLLKDDTQVKAIHNHLSIEENISSGMKANDKWLGVKTRSRMFTTDYFPSSKIEIVVQQGVVYLMGRVSKATARQAVQITSEVNGVQKVVMVLQIIQ